MLIGGTAATLIMLDAGLDFRATRDLDIVLELEALDPAFGRRFWEFIQQGGYEVREASAAEPPRLYRFQRPANERFPTMLEIFCRSPAGLDIGEGAELTPIPLEDATSLSAIVLDDQYYELIVRGRRMVEGLPTIGAEQLIPLKAHAWLDLSERRARGEAIDQRDVRKHGNDVLRLAQLLAPGAALELAPPIAADLVRFLDGIVADGRYDPRQLDLRSTLPEAVGRIREVFRLGDRGQDG